MVPAGGASALRSEIVDAVVAVAMAVAMAGSAVAAAIAVGLVQVVMACRHATAASNHRGACAQTARRICCPSPMLSVKKVKKVTKVTKVTKVPATAHASP